VRAILAAALGMSLTVDQLVAGLKRRGRTVTGWNLDQTLRKMYETGDVS
jgi:hypothetical protein